MKKPIPNSVCDDCINADCVWRSPTGGLDPPVIDCPDKETPPITNYHLLISKTPEELAEWIAKILDHCENKKPEELCRQSCPLYKCCNDQPSDNIEDWLKSPVEVDNGRIH